MQKNSPFQIWTAVFLAIPLFFFSESFAQTPKVGRKAAAQYFQNDAELARRPSQASGDQVLMLSLGTFIGSKAYQWKGSGTRDNVGRTSYGVTYLMDQWTGMDVNLRADFNEYKVEDDRAVKLSLLPLLTFPHASSRFPLYFGLGLGLGVFFQQVSEESNLSLDYQLVAGARFMDLFENVGFFFELGLKNHLHILSDGQFNGTALTAGGIFSF
jgi:hypothetical protein